jgi:hypothetical protein
MTDQNPQSGSDRESSLKGVVRVVSSLGERARLLSVQLAVAAAKVQQDQRGKEGNDEILDLVARVTRLSQSVTDAVTAVQSGLPQTKLSVPGVWRSSEMTGVPDEATLDRLTRSLEEATEMAEQVFQWVRTNVPAAVTDDDSSRDGIPWANDEGDQSAK